MTLHSETLTFLAGSTRLVIAFVHLRMIKGHVVDLHYDYFWWYVAQYMLKTFVFSISIAFWIVALRQTKNCLTDTWNWLTSTVACGAVLTLLVLLVHFILSRRRNSSNKMALDETDAILMKTNSKPNISFQTDNVSFCGVIQPNPGANQTSLKRVGSKTSKQSTTSKSGNKVAVKPTSSQTKKKSEEAPPAPKNNNNKDDETLDNAFGQGSSYMKTKNRNSISQYV